MSIDLTLHNRLVHSVQLETPTVTSDQTGGFETVWAPLKTVFAEIIPQGQGGRSGGTHPSPLYAQYRLTLRADAAITLPLRAIWKNQVLHVTYIEDYQSYLVLHAEMEIAQ